MKKTLTSYLLFLSPLFMFNLLAQDSLRTLDPVLKFKHFMEEGLSVNYCRVNTTQINYHNGLYTFEQGKSSWQSSDIAINFGWIKKTSDNKTLVLFKTGINMVNRAADLKDSTGKQLNYSLGSIQIPVMMGFRLPLRYNTIKNGFFRAIEWCYGPYIGFSVWEKLDSRNNYDSRGNFVLGNYIRMGLVSTLCFTSLNEKGRGHKIGLRANVDFTSLLNNSENHNAIHPAFLTAGIYYNLFNKFVCVKICLFD